MIKNKKYYLYIFIFLISVLIIFLFSKKSSQNKQKSPIEAETINTLIASSSSQIQLNNDISTIKLPNETKNQNITINDYNVEFVTTSNLVNNIIKTFQIRNPQKEDLGEGITIWKTEEIIILHTPEMDIVDVQFLKTTTPKTGIDPNQLKNTSLDIIKKIAPESEFVVSDIGYYKDENPDPEIVNSTNSKLAQVGLNQIINGLPVTPNKLSNRHTVTLTIDSNLNPRFISIRKIIQNSVKTSKFTVYDSNLTNKIEPNMISRLTPLPISTEKTIKASSDNEFETTSIQPAYSIIGDKITPMLILDGNITNKGYVFGKASYAAPIPITPEL